MTCKTMNNISILRNSIETLLLKDGSVIHTLSMKHIKILNRNMQEVCPTLKWNFCVVPCGLPVAQKMYTPSIIEVEYYIGNNQNNTT